LAADEALLEPDPKIRREKLALAVSAFKQMFVDPSRLPKHMPMAHEISPAFARRFPEIAATFDNLHTFHDIYMDILTNPAVRDKRDEAYRQLSVMLDPKRDLERMPSLSLPSMSLEAQQSLLQMGQEEHMAMMMMSVDEQLRFIGMTPEERKKMRDKMMQKMEQMEGHSER
jgi:hypothetical protein